MKKLLSHLDLIAPSLLLLYVFFSGRLRWRANYVLWYIAFEAVVNTLQMAVNWVFGWNNLFIYHFNCAVSLWLLAAYFAHLLPYPRTRLGIWVAAVVSTAFFISNAIWWEPLFTAFCSNSYMVTSLVLVTCSFLYYLDKLSRPATERIAASRDFWYVTGIFTYFASDFFIFITYRTFTQKKVPQLWFLWQIHNLVFLLMCIYLLIGILCKPSLEKYNL